MTPSYFLQKLYANVPAGLDGQIVVSTFVKMPGEEKPRVAAGPIPFQDLEELDDSISQLVAAGKDAYFGVGLRVGGLQRDVLGKKKEVLAVPAFWLDIDFGSAGHASTTLPTEDEAVEILAMAPSEPTMLVRTGGGYHAYWVLDKPWILNTASEINAAESALKAFQNPIIAKAQERGWHVDDTAKITQILRIPGTMNFKLPDNPRPVQLLLHEGPTFDFALAAQTFPPAAAPSVAAPAGIPIVSTFSMENMLRNLKGLKNTVHRKWIFDTLLQGKSFAPMGNRDKALQRLCSVLAFAAPDGTTAPDLMKLMQPMFDNMEREDNDPRGHATMLEKAVDKSTRALQDALSKRQNTKAEQQAFFLKHAGAPEVVRLGSTEGAPAGHYSKEDLAGFAEALGVSVKELKKRWIIQSGSSYYIFADGKYLPPVSEKSLLIHLRDDLRTGFQVEEATNTGSRLLSKDEIVQRIGTGARHIVAHLDLDKSYYSPEEDTFHEALCKLRPLTPEFAPKVDELFRLMGGPKEEKLLDWLATVTDLKHQTSALYLSGMSDGGKTLLAQGLSRLWTTGGPTELEDATGNFNESIKDCPLLLADEGLQCNSKMVRRIIGSSSRTLRRKYLASAPLIGCVRLVINDNGNGKLLDHSEDLGQEDVDAIANKILHIPISQAPVDFLKGLGGPTKGTKGWVDEDVIAKHVLWLRDNRPVSYGNRLLVSGDADSMSRNLATHDKNSSLMCEWILGYLHAPLETVKANKTVLVGDGHVYVNGEAIQGHWKHYIQSVQNPPTRHMIGKALKKISVKGTDQVRISNFRYYDIDASLVLGRHDLGIGDEEKMWKKIKQSSKETK